MVQAFGSKPLDSITRDDVEAHQKRRQQDGKKPATINRERTVLSHLFKMSRKWKLTQSNPGSGTDPLPEANEHPRPLSHDEEERLFRALLEYYKPIVTLALHTGLRLGELRAQEWRDVDLPGGTLLVTRPKSKQRESVPLNEVAFALLAGLEQEGPLLFPTMPKKMSDYFVRYLRKAGIEEITFHCLRDTYISRLAQYCNTPTLMALARHRDYKTTRRYVRIDGAHLKQAVEQLVPSPKNHPLTGTATGTDVSRLL